MNDELKFIPNNKQRNQGNDGIAGEFQNKEHELDQDFATSENQPKACNPQNESVQEAQRTLQIRQMRLLEALTPCSCIHIQKNGTFDLPLSHKNATMSDLQTEPPSIFESTESNSRYKDVSKLFSLFDQHNSDSDSYDDEDHQSDGSTISSILKCTHIIGEA